MLEHRWQVSNWQMQHFPNDLPTTSSKIIAMGKRFTNTQPAVFDFTFDTSRKVTKIYGGILLAEVLFFLFKKEETTQLVSHYFFGVLVFTLLYLKLDWTRYYLPLVPFVIILLISYTNLLFSLVMQKVGKIQLFSKISQ